MRGDLAEIIENSTQGRFSINYPIPHIDDFSQNLHGKKIFTTLDFIRAYNQILMHSKDIPKTITTPFGLFKLIHVFWATQFRTDLPRFMNEITDKQKDLKFCYVYINDILVASRDEKEHEEHLRKFFK